MKRALMTLALAAATLFTTAAAHAQVGVAVRVGPVAVYANQYPGDGYVWVDGYYDQGFWVPGSWVYQGNGYAYGNGYGRPYARPYYGHPYYAHPYNHGYYGHRR